MKRRVQPEESRVELHLVPTVGNGAAKTDASMRFFAEDSLVFSASQNFGQPEIAQGLSEELSKHKEEFKRVQLELDLNIERVAEEGEDFNTKRDFIVSRVAMTAFRFDRFLRSLKQREDEEFNALTQKHAAMDRLPTLENLTASEIPENLVEHLMEVGMEGHLALVKRFLLGTEDALGISVSFKNLRVTQQRNRGNCLCSKYNPRDPPVELLKNLTGVIPSGRLTLLLGAPHSGKTQLLHALSRQTKSDKVVRVTGDIFYNKYNSLHVVPSNFCTVVEQTDVHIPNLTVRETLEFAHLCRNKNSTHNEVFQKLLKSRVAMIMALLGLTRVADTVIGNENLKGISGGEMRRVTLGEMLVVGAKVLLLDEISTGLDSAATFDITKSIRSLCNVMNATGVISLLQPPPETFELFQDVILMSKGHIVYQGEVSSALLYFNQLGRNLDRVMDVADFLIETSLQNIPELVQAYQASPQFQAFLAFDPSTQVPPPSNALAVAFEQRLVNAKRFSFSYAHLTKVVFRRQGQILLRNRPFIFARVAQNIIMGLLIGALFFSIPFYQYYLVAMVFSQLCSMAGFSMMALLGDILTARNTYYKQSRESFFPALSYIFADYIVGLPFNLMDGLILGTISYFMAGLSVSSNGAPYFIFLIILISYGVCMATATRFFGYISPDQPTAFSITVFFNIMSLIFGGAIATPAIIPPWWIWYYWVFSPIAWAYRSMLQNEFYSDKYQAICESGCPNNIYGQCIQFCATPINGTCLPPFPNVTCGVYFLEARQVETPPYFLWLGVGMLWIYTLVFLGLSWIALIYVRYDIKRAHLSDEEEVASSSQAAPAPPPTAEAAADVEGGGGIVVKESHTLVWKNLVYTIEIKDAEERGKRHEVDLLKNISGFAKPFEMTALMGSSGAGKTTLLDCLCYRKTMGKIKGEILLNGVQVVPRSFQKQVGYVEQFGIHNNKSTVMESLQFSAALRLPRTTSREDRLKFVTKSCSLLELESIANLMAGDLSFEENKRLTIAVELCADAKILFADEPTSGLTSKEAMLTMRALLRVTKCGVPVIATIHQPSSEIFFMFHRLLLLKRGGEIAFFGPLTQLVSYFESIPDVEKMKVGMNPATYMLEVIGAGVGRKTASSTLDFAEMYRSSDLHASNTEIIESLLHHDFQIVTEEQSEKQALLTNVDKSDEDDDGDSTLQKVNQSYATQFKVLLRRFAQEFNRTPTYTHLRWLILLFFALVTGTLFLQQQLSTAAGVQSRVTVINLLLLLSSNYNSATMVPFVFQHRALFYRERNSGMYEGTLFALSHQLIELPWILLEVGLSTVVFYFLVGMTSAANVFFYYVFLMYFFVLFVSFFGACMAAGVGMQGAASLMSSLIIQLMVLFSGVAVPGNLLAAWLLGGYYISPVRWAMEGLVVSQFMSYSDVICNPSGVISTWLPTAPMPPISQCGGGNFTYLSDVNLNACCDSASNRPISAKAYVLTGWVYDDGFVTKPWLGGVNGYNVDWTGYDYLYVVCSLVIVSVVYVLLTQFMSHQKR